MADLMNGLVQDHRRWRLPQHPRLEASSGDARRAFLGGPPVRFPRPFVLVTGGLKIR
jgi:hypothetical protein